MRRLIVAAIACAAVLASGPLLHATAGATEDPVLPAQQVPPSLLIHSTAHPCAFFAEAGLHVAKPGTLTVWGAIFLRPGTGPQARTVTVTATGRSNTGNVTRARTIRLAQVKPREKRRFLLALAEGGATHTLRLVARSECR